MIDPVPELKEKKIAIAEEPEIVGGPGSIYRPPEKAVKMIDPVPELKTKEPIALESEPIALAKAPVAAPVLETTTAAPPQAAKANPASDCQKLKEAAK